MGAAGLPVGTVPIYQAALEAIEKHGAIVKMTADDLAKSLAKKDLVIWDIRDADSFASEHIVDSINVDPANFSGEKQQTDKNKIYVLIDDLGDTAPGIIQTSFWSDDYKNVYFLDGGFSGWKDNAGATVTQGDPNSFTDQAKVTYISSDDLKKIVEDAPSIDVALLILHGPNGEDGTVQGLLDLVAAKLAKDDTGKIISDATKLTELQRMALWNYNLVKNDGSLGVHNTAYSIQVLQRTYRELTGSDVPGATTK